MKFGCSIITNRLYCKESLMFYDTVDEATTNYNKTNPTLGYKIHLKYVACDSETNKIKILNSYIEAKRYEKLNQL